MHSFTSQLRNDGMPFICYMQILSVYLTSLNISDKCMHTTKLIFIFYPLLFFYLNMHKFESYSNKTSNTALDGRFILNIV